MVQGNAKHGDASYRRGCRCGTCRAAHAAALREWRSGPAARRFAVKRRALAAKLSAAAAGLPADPLWPFVQGRCGWCGESFTRRGMASAYCSKRCNKAARRKAAKTDESRKHSAQWISRRDREAIYRRDRWVCQLCFKPVDKTLHFLDDWAASLDHIVCRSWTSEPDHSPSNLRLAHRICNSKRGDGGWGDQLAASA